MGFTPKEIRKRIDEARKRQASTIFFSDDGEQQTKTIQMSNLDKDIIDEYELDNQSTLNTDLDFPNLRNN